MRERERRSLHKSICTSKKVNALSLKGEILYYRSITWEDDEGYQEGDPRTLKHNLVPFRDDIPLEEIKGLILEICTIHEKVNDSTPLWNLFHIGNKVFIQNPVADKRQTYHGVHKIPSEIRKLIGNAQSTKLKWCSSGAVMVQTGAQRVPKLSEVKLSEVKGSEVKESTKNIISLSEEEQKKAEEKKKKEREEINRKFQSYKEKENRI